MQVAELWQFHDLQGAPGTGVLAELVGNEHLRWGFPGGDCVVLINEYFITCHDNDHRVPEWVGYRLTSEMLLGNAQRSDDFRADARLPAGQRAELVDYVDSGYDRGHMAPAAAFRRSEEAMSQTFLLSNMTPQTPSLNRQMWRLLEEDVRELARAAGSTWVFTGSLFLDETGALTEPSTFIGANRVAVPTHFYKAMLALSPAFSANAAYAGNTGSAGNAAGSLTLFALLMPNQTDPLDGAPADYLVSVDLVEALSGLDFFSALPDALEESLEEKTAATWPVS